jgi:hypothetical protein
MPADVRSEPQHARTGLIVESLDYQGLPWG